MKILVTVGALALAASLAGIQVRSSGAQRLNLEDVKGLQGGACVTNRAFNTDKVKFNGSGYFFNYSQLYLVPCLRVNNSSFFLFYCEGGTVTQTFMSTGTVQCASDPGGASAFYVTATSGPFGSFNISRIYGGFCGNLTDVCS